MIRKHQVSTVVLRKGNPRTGVRGLREKKRGGEREALANRVSDAQQHHLPRMVLMKTTANPRTGVLTLTHKLGKGF
jgi:hypothetical protein